MKTRKCARTLLLTLGTVFACAAPSSVAQQAAQEKVTPAKDATDETESDGRTKGKSFWMEQKLRLSKEILTGLALADFEAIGKSSEVMRGINRVEAFVRRGPDGYRDYLKQFNLANRALIKASQTENLEAATLAFNQLTVSCVNCHKHIRQEGE